MSTRWPDDIPMEEVTSDNQDNPLLDWSERNLEGVWTPPTNDAVQPKSLESSGVQDLPFQEPVFVQLPLADNKAQPLETTTIPPQRTFSFRGNYRRFLILLFVTLSLGFPLVYLTFKSLGLAHPLQATLYGLTGLWGLSCGMFYLGPYRRRSITVDHFGFHYQDELRSAYVTWKEVDSVHLHAVEAYFNPYPLCYVRLVTTTGMQIAFANFGTHLFGTQRDVSFGNPPYPIIDVRDADFLLALLVQQTKEEGKAPDLERLRYRAQQEMDTDDVEEEMRLIRRGKVEKENGQGPPVGLLALLTKFGLNWLPQSAKFLIQTVKPGYVGLSVGLYALFFQWQFALVLGLLLVGHELGHVWAMYREGMRIRGVYLIPFFGAATVTEDTWPSWGSLARVSLAGPLWGTYLTGICFGLYILFPSPFWLMATVLGALLNLLNLLPVQPLDGGRILHAIAYSMHSAQGLSLIILVLGGAILLSLWMKLLLLFLLSVIGLAEFFREYMFHQRAQKLSLVLDKANLSARDVLLLKSITGINFGLNSAPHVLEREETLLKRLHMLLQAPRMSKLQMVKIGGATFAVAGALFGFLVLMAQYQPSTQWVLNLFQ
ncbi:MAG: hypothetical protein EP343_10215 [Deltaproteobacteria bacterium]|nr:MAG: hypothetical protein EP343_10215 [Deltaproteobacteria bacterium]